MRARNKICFYGMKQRHILSKDVGTSFSDGHRMLGMRGEFAVFGNIAVAVRAVGDFPTALDNHRFDRDDHAWLKRDALARFAVIQNFRFFMDTPADAVTDKIANHPASLGFHICLDRVAYIASGIARASLFDAEFQCALRYGDKFFLFRTARASKDGPCGVGMEAFV